MNFKAFSEETFDAVDWVNEAFSSATDIASKESYASNLVYKLQLFVQEINGSLEETAQQVIYNMPKVLQEAESLQDEVDSLKQELISVRENLTNVNEESVQSMENLKSVNAVKQKMETFLQEKR